MGTFDDALRSLQIHCPTCLATDIPGLLPILTRHAGGRMTCTRCQTNFQPPSFAYRRTQDELAHDHPDPEKDNPS